MDKQKITKNDPSIHTEAIMDYIAKYGVIQKDACREATTKDKNTNSKIQKSKNEQRISLDLHGYTQDESIRRVREAFQKCKQRGIKQLLIIHGKGTHSSIEDGAVLKKLIQSLITNEYKNLIKNHSSARPKDGGDGATLIHLK